MLTEKRSSMLHGVLLIALFSCAAFYIGSAQVVRELSLSPMIIGIVLGMLYANSLRNNLPETWVPGIQFCSLNGYCAWVSYSTASGLLFRTYSM